MRCVKGIFNTTITNNVNSVDKLVDKLNNRYNTTYFKKCNDNNTEYIVIGDLIVLTYNNFTRNMPLSVIQENAFRLCDENKELIKKKHKKENIKTLKGQIKCEIIYTMTL